MTNMESTKFLTALQENEEFAKRAAEAKTPEALTALMRELEIEITAEEAADILAQVDEKLSSEELDEETLEAVNGGIGHLLACAIYGGVAGVVIGLCVVAAYYYLRKGAR